MIKLKLKSSDIEKKSGGSKTATTIVEDRYLKRLCLKNRHASALHLKVRLEKACAVNISALAV